MSDEPQAGRAHRDGDGSNMDAEWVLKEINRIEKMHQQKKEQEKLILLTDLSPFFHKMESLVVRRDAMESSF